MALIKSGTVVLELTPEEFELVRKACKSMQTCADYEDQEELDALIALRDDLGRAPRG